MPATVTSNFRIVNAKAFVDSFEEPENGGRDTVVGQSYVYLFIGKILSWDKTHAGYSDTLIPSPDGDIQGNEFEPWRDMIALDRVIANTDISFAAKRYDWVASTVYAQYDDQDPTISKAASNYYVYETDSSRVFKCLDNNNGALSTVNPKDGYTVEHLPFVTSDGYRWKYMCTVNTPQFSKWLTTNYVPIRTLNAVPFSGDSGQGELAGDGIPEHFADQADVQKNANNGTIETYVITSGGSGFLKHSGGVADSDRVVVALGVNTTFFTIKADISLTLGTQNYYTGAAIFLSNSSAQKGVTTIVESGDLYAHGPAFIPATGQSGLESRSILVDPPFAAEMAPLPGDTYHIAPRIEVIGDGLRNSDGSGGANAYAICISSGEISQINAWTTGNNYTTATVSTPDASGIGLQARAVISPPGGHGSDPVAELGAFNIVISKTLTGSGVTNPVTELENNFPISNQYRTVGLVRNPYLKEGYDATQLAPATDGKNWYANSSPLHQSTWITANTNPGAPGGQGDSYIPAEDDEIKGLTSGVTGIVVEYNSHNNDGLINITNVVANSSGGTFMFNERIALVKTKSGQTNIDNSKYITANGWVDSNTPTEWPGDMTHDGTTTPLREPDLQPYTGKILYIENRSPITRSADQAEEIKLVIEF